MVTRSLCALLGMLLCPPALIRAEDFFLVQSVAALDFMGDRLPGGATVRPGSRFFTRAKAMFPYAAVDGAMVSMVDNATEHGVPILNLAKPRAEDAIVAKTMACEREFKFSANSAISPRASQGNA